MKPFTYFNVIFTQIHQNKNMKLIFSQNLQMFLLFYLSLVVVILLCSSWLPTPWSSVMPAGKRKYLTTSRKEINMCRLGYYLYFFIKNICSILNGYPSISMNPSHAANFYFVPNPNWSRMELLNFKFGVTCAARGILRFEAQPSVLTSCDYSRLRNAKSCAYVQLCTSRSLH